MINDGRREVERREEEGGMLSEGSWRWRGNEAGMRVISFQDVRNRTEGQRVSDVLASVYVCAYLLRQVGEDLGADPVQSLHDLSLWKESVFSLKEKTGVIVHFWFCQQIS